VYHDIFLSAGMPPDTFPIMGVLLGPLRLVEREQPHRVVDREVGRVSEAIDRHKGEKRFVGTGVSGRGTKRSCWWRRCWPSGLVHHKSVEHRSADARCRAKGKTAPRCLSQPDTPVLLAYRQRRT
jgi:hypothetical protein